MSSLFLKVLFIQIFIVKIFANNSCETKTKCDTCILDPNICVWCVMKNMTDVIRCKSAKQAADWCKDTDIENPQSDHKIITNKDFTSDHGRVIQIKPQNIDMALRVGDTQKFKFSYLAAKNYPVDLYFLLDASQSMQSTKDAVEKQGKDIHRTMLNLTNNVFMGLGTFIDKNAMPYVFDNTSLTYSFKNELKLTSNVEEFVKSVKRYEIGSNFDGPEGGFDALSQVISCKKEIGWRKESRKIVVFMTSSAYHATGDGKWAGIFKPHDGKCYMKNNSYTEELNLDYPSISLINKLATDNKVTIMFITTDPNVAGIYKSLQNVIKGSHHVELHKSNEVLNKLTDIYKKISSSVLLKINILDNLVKQKEHVEIKINPDCTENKINKSPKCFENKKVDFEGTIKILDYNGVENFTINILTEGIDEKLSLDIHIIKECNCDKRKETNAPICYHGGSYQCGICNCNNNRYGENCRCTVNEIGYADKSSCIDNATNLICNGHGECDCGTCICFENFEGPFCGCGRSSCYINSVDGSLCSGHGVCDCGVCRCNPGWTSAACDCTTSNDTCIDPNSQTVCFNRGTCECGICECRPPSSWDIRQHSDKYCTIESCLDPSCDSRQCNALSECALCLYHEYNNNNTFECEEKCDNYIKPVFVKNIESILNTTGDWKECSEIKTAIGCYTKFLYKYNGDEVNIVIQLKSDCVESYFMYGGISLGLVLLVGILTAVAWKLLTDARDRREYENFKKQSVAALWSDTTNPIYTPASTTFTNPRFKKSVAE